MKEAALEMNFFFVMMYYGLDHGLQIQSYLKPIMKTNCWLLQVEEGR